MLIIKLNSKAETFSHIIVSPLLITDNGKALDMTLKLDFKANVHKLACTEELTEMFSTWLEKSKHM